MSELDHHEEELKQPDNQHVVGYMKEAQQLFAQIKSPKPLCLDWTLKAKKVSGIVREQRHQVILRNTPPRSFGSWIWSQEST